MYLDPRPFSALQTSSRILKYYFTHWESVQCFKDWCNMVHFPGGGQDSSSSILVELQLLAIFFIETCTDTTRITKPPLTGTF